MPLASVVCSCSKEFSPASEVLAHLSDRKSGCEFTYELAASILEQVQDRQDRISTTTLTAKCIRSEVLKRKEPYTESLQKQWAAFRGTLYHGQLEWHAKEDSIAEARYHMVIDGLGPFSGSPDLLDPKAGVLYDYKTNKENPRFAYPWPDHVEQVNINRWLVDHATTVEWQGSTYNLVPAAPVRDIFVPKEWHSLVLVYIDDKGPKPLTCTRSEEVLCKNGNKRKARVPDIWSDDRVEALVRRKYAAAKQALTGNEIPDIPEAFRYWEHPLCAYCPVKGRCVELELQHHNN